MHGPAVDIVGTNSLMFTRLIPKENVETPEAREKLAEAILTSG